MAAEIFFYARVSTKTQDTVRQLEAFEDFVRDNRDKNWNVRVKDRFYSDKITGKVYDRPEYKAMKENMRSGDILVIKDLDRLGRTSLGIKKELMYFKEKKIKVIVIGLPTTKIAVPRFDDNGNVVEDAIISTYMQLCEDIMIEIMSWTAEQEREKIIERSREGKKAKLIVKDGKLWSIKTKEFVGRPRVKRPRNFNKIMSDYISGNITGVEAYKRLKISKSAFYVERNRYLGELRETVGDEYVDNLIKEKGWKVN